MNEEALPAALALAVAFFVGARSTWRLWRDYRAISASLRPMSRSIGKAFVVVSAVVTAGALYFGILSIIRLFDFEPISWAPAVSLTFALAVLFLPLYLERTWARIR